MTRITAKELKKELKSKFPGVKFSVTRTKSLYGNFLNVRFDWHCAEKWKISEYVGKYQSIRDPMADGVELGSQVISLYNT